MPGVKRVKMHKNRSRFPLRAGVRVSGASVSYACPPRQVVSLTQKDIGDHIVYCVVPISERKGPEHIVAAVRRFVSSQSILRSVFRVSSSGEIVLREYGTVAVNIPVCALPGPLSLPGPKVLLRAISEGFRTFNIFDGPLYRLQILQVAEGRYLLIWFISHLLANDRALFYSLGRALDFHSGIGRIARKPVFPQATYREYISERNREWESLSKAKKEILLDVFRGYSKAADIFRGRMGRGACKIGNINFTVAVPKTLLHRNLEVVLSGVIAKYFFSISGVADVPLALIYHGRYFGKVNYFNLVGDFCDVIPIVARRQWGDLGTVCTNIGRLLERIMYRGVNLTNVFVRMGLNSDKKYLSSFSNQDAPIVINFIPYLPSRTTRGGGSELVEAARTVSGMCAAQKKSNVKNLSFKIVCNIADGTTLVSLKYNDSLKADFRKMREYFQRELNGIADEKIDSA